MLGKKQRDKLPSASGIPVHCAHSALAAIEDVKPAPRNPNTHPDVQIALLAKLIHKHGWRAPITVSRQSGYVVRGHARLMAAKLLELDTVPVDYQDYETEALERADLIADNRIAELAELDKTILKDMLQELDTGAFDMDLTGYTHDALEDLMTAAPPPSADVPSQLELQPHETFDYVIFFFRDSRDWSKAVQSLGLEFVESSPSPKTSKIGLGRCLDGKRLLPLLPS